MSPKQINCPSCGASLTLESRLSEMVVCGYCDQTSYLTGNSLASQGEKVKLADYGTKFFIGAQGTVLDKKFKVLGRIRFQYPGGFWDEWFLVLDNNFEKEYWLQEDEGDYTLFEQSEQLPEPTDFAGLVVGNTYAVGKKEFFISEKNTANVVGGEGELPHQVIPGEKADFVDGIIIGEGLQGSLEFLPSENQFYISTQAVKLDDFMFNKKVEEDVY